MPGMAYTSANIAVFDAYIRSLGLKHFEPSELRIHCEHSLNGLPPKKLWSNIASTIRVLDEFREVMGAPILLNSTYRSPEYNAHIGGATNSNHKYFCACDWWIKGHKVNSAMRERIDQLVRKKLKSSVLSRAGRGFYSGSFMHLDTNHDNGARPLGQLVGWSG